MKPTNRFFKKATLRACQVVTPLLLTAGCTQQHLAATEPEGTSIPAIASMAKIQIGYSTQEDLERSWGRGKIVTGGHPNSGRLWRVSGTPWVLHTDGFEYSERGLVVDSLTISEDRHPEERVPFANLAASDFAWLGAVSLGMSEAEEGAVLKRNGLSVSRTESGCEAQAKGFHALVGSGSFQTWTVHFSFMNGMLNELQMNAHP